MLVALLALVACGRLPPGHRLPGDDRSQACLARCLSERDHCRAALGRAYQRCLRSHPGQVLDQDRCFDAASRRIIAALPVPPRGETCEARFDDCFTAACGGTIDAPSEGESAGESRPRREHGPGRP